MMSDLWKTIQVHVGVTPDGIAGAMTARAVAMALGLHEALAGGQRIGPAGIALIKQHEGCRLSAYPDPGTGSAPWTIGYGSTTGVSPGMTITQAQADARLTVDLARFEAAVRTLCPVATQGQFDALVSLAFNIGEAALRDSTLRRLHVAGDHAGAAAQFQRWRFAAGRELPGLVRRRAAEQALYEGRA
ncbi:MAG TPA: lysozyme [Sphingobium sp.]|nr:lysozyme [Sphingobium sp.]